MQNFLVAIFGQTDRALADLAQKLRRIASIQKKKRKLNEIGHLQ